MTLRLSTPGNGLDNYVVTHKVPDGQRQVMLTPEEVESYSELLVEQLHARLKDPLADTFPQPPWSMEDVSALQNSMRDALKKGPYPPGQHLAERFGLVTPGRPTDECGGKFFEATLFKHDDGKTWVQIIVDSDTTPADLIQDRINARILEAFGTGPSVGVVSFEPGAGDKGATVGKSKHGG